MSPTRVPMTVATSAARRPTVNETRAPHTISLKMSWPMSFVPSRCLADGRSNGKPTPRVGSYGATKGANTAANAMLPTRSAPVIVSFEGRGIRAVRAGSGKVIGGLAMRPHARVEHRVHELDQQIGRDHGERRDDEAGLQQRVVAGDDGLEDEPPQPRVREHRLDDDRTAEYKAHAQHEQGRDGKQRIPQRVPEEDP